MPKITVLLPCWNARHVVNRALDSLLDQDFSDFEVLAVDDGSDDSTLSVLEEYAGQDKRVRPLAQEHRGLVAALNAGLGEARGAYVARMDADDLCLPGRLSAQAALLDRNPDLGLAGCRVCFGGDRDAAAGYARYVDWTNSLLDHEAISLHRFVESPLPHPSVMFRAETAASHGAYRDGDFPEDYELWLRWLEQGVRMAKADAELVVWNDPPDRLSRTDSRYSFDAFYRVKAEYLARWLLEHGHARVGVLGAGRITRLRAGLLAGHGVKIVAWYDIDPRKVDRDVGGVPVSHRDDVPPPGELFLLSYVANHGAREDIGAHLAGRGYVLGRHWLPAA